MTTTRKCIDFGVIGNVMRTGEQTNQSQKRERARPRIKYRRVVKGHAYDTETASCLAFWDCTWEGPNIGEDLYVNVHGHYFVLRHDSENISCYISDPDDRWDQYLTLEPLTRKQAIDWCSKYQWRLVEELFGRMPEKGEADAYGKPTHDG